MHAGPIETPASTSWLVPFEPAARDVVACWRVAGQLRPFRRALRARVSDGAAPRILAEQEAIADALEAVLRSMPDDALRLPGGEEDWNVAQTFAHATAARRFLSTWAALDAGAAPSEDRAPVVTPSLPGRPDVSREDLLILLDKSRRAVREAAARIGGHETQTCRMRHPLVGRLRCGEWLLFIGVHDVMHLEQLHRLAARAVADG